MKPIILLVALFGPSVAYAQSPITISDLLADGYEIVAASSRSEHSALVFLQKRKSAFMCAAGPRGSRCFALK